MKQLVLAASAVLAAGSSFGQVVLPPSADPGALQQRRIDEEQRRQEQERLERKPIADPLREPAPPPAAAPAAAPSVRFMLKDIRFDPPSALLPPEEIKGMAAAHIGQEVSLADMQALVERINTAYRDRGIVTARALIAPQDVTDGLFTIRLVEGRLGQVTVSGNQATRESYVVGRVQAKPDQLIDLPSLQASLVQFNRTNDAQLRAELKPGQSFGRTDLDIAVMEPSRHVFRIGIDNYGSEATGENRLGLSYTNQSLLGWRDALTLGAMTASGLNSLSVDYGFPVSRSGGRLNLTVNRDDTALKHGPFAELDITGESTAVALSLRQPLHFTVRSQTVLLAGLRRRDVENDISDIFLSGTKSDDVQLGVEYQHAGDASQWVASYSLHSGRATSSGERTTFTVGRGAVRHARFWGGGWGVRGTVSFQHTSSEGLPSSEYFFLGGEGSVRGYPVGALSGDRGLILSMELQHPLVSAKAGGSFSANGYFFLDAGHVTFVLPPDSILDKSRTLSSLGWGANLYFGRHVSARVTLAYALDKLPEEDKRLSVRFMLNSQF